MQVVIDNILLNYQIFGNEKENPVLILHGWGRSTKEWITVGEELSDNHKVILLDLPGFGDSSSPPKEIFDIYDYQKTVNTFAKKLGLKKITLIGHSFGGKIGIVFCANSNLVEKLILINSSGVESKSFKTNIINSLSSALKPIIQKLPDEIQSKIISSLASQDYLNSGKLRESFKLIIKQNITAEAKMINCSTIIIWGEHDKVVSITSAKKLHKLIKKSILRIIWDSGHNPHLTHSEIFLNLLREYI